MNNHLSPKERLAIPRTQMPAQDPVIRSRNFSEVNLGLAELAAIEEAQRCLLCHGRNCVSGCPVGVSIPEFVGNLASGNLTEAAGILQQDNALPAVCGRVCPQESQCEAQCVRGKKGDPVAIGHLERFVADWAMSHSENLDLPSNSKPSGKRVAVVGCGPAGLTVAGELVGKGHGITIFEALHDTGGVLRYGIPEFRLPKEIIDIEVERLIDRGVKIECNVIIGKTLTLQDLQRDYDAIFLGNGAGLPVLLGIEGENLNGVYAANEYLTRVNLMGAGQTVNCSTPIIRGKKVAVIGAGNTAMDCVRTARRLGAEEAMIVYRREEAQMPARLEEVHHAKEEGVKFVMLSSPLAVIGDENDWVKALHCQKMALGEADDSGRRRPVPIDGETFMLEADVVINALGTSANPLLTSTVPELQLNRWGNITVNDEGATNLPGVFAGGDIVRGGATVILAMGDGKRAAHTIDNYLSTLPKTVS
ncbi:NADPH-dependent glutamate synthase [Malonomonas rubra]|uniref:NADPH-dependent glutamate synthase n=1 Tax=Malonomonas rubra TaxID=57040 RepID=UPI0026F14923|nr:NADPH-dependent glutamate synthase [Malonomonas rubra]